jgi:hypothetical protein
MAGRIRSWSNRSVTPRQLLSPQTRAALFDPPLEIRAIVRHYTFSIKDVTLIRQRRRNANRFGFAVHLAYMRFPGRVLGPSEIPSEHLIAFIADQLRINPKAFEQYAQRDETRREHLAELQAYLGVRPFGREDYRTMTRIAFNESIGTDRGDAIVGAMVIHLQQCSILLPSAAVLEKIGLAARARARKQAYKALTAGVDQAVREKLDALIQVADGETRSTFAWLREWSEAPLQGLAQQRYVKSHRNLFRSPRSVSRCPLLVECQASVSRADSTDKGQQGCCRLSVECGP